MKKKHKFITKCNQQQKRKMQIKSFPQNIPAAFSNFPKVMFPKIHVHFVVIKNNLFFTNMNGWKLITLSIVYFFFTSSKSAANAAAVMSTFEPFYGDMALERYIEQTICSVVHEPNRKWSFVYVHQLNIAENFTTKQTTRVNSTPPFKAHLLQCFTAVYRQTNASQLSASLNSVHFQYKEVLTVINLLRLSSVSLAQTLTTLNSLYIACSRCLPFLLLLPPNAQPNSLKRAHSSAQLNSTFPLRAVITSFSPTKLQTFHLNPVLDGCRQTSGLLFEPQTEHDFHRLKTTTQCHLNNTELVASVNEDQPYCHVLVKKDKNETASFGGDYSADVDLLAMLQRRYHFRVRLRYAHQAFSPRYNATKGKWVGITGHVFCGAAHLGLCGLSTVLSRRSFVDFTHFTAMDSYAPLTRYPGLQSRQWLAVEPFSGAVWLLVGVSFGLIIVLNRVFQKSETKSSLSLSASVEALYRILLKNCE